jgi:hypothetical protein
MSAYGGVMTKKSERFSLVLSSAEKWALQQLAELERIPAAAVIRRLIWREAESLNALSSPDALRTLGKDDQDE